MTVGTEIDDGKGKGVQNADSEILSSKIHEICLVVTWRWELL